MKIAIAFLVLSSSTVFAVDVCRLSTEQLIPETVTDVPNSGGLAVKVTPARAIVGMVCTNEKDSEKLEASYEKNQQIRAANELLIKLTKSVLEKGYRAVDSQTFLKD